MPFWFRLHFLGLNTNTDRDADIWSIKQTEMKNSVLSLKTTFS